VKRTVLGLVSVLALAVSAPVDAANAADMAVKAPPPPPMAPVPAYFNWTGFYVGANVGGGWANTSASGSTLFDEPPFAPIASTFAGSYGASGVLGGGQIGANYQFPNHWVIGLEADVDGSSLSGSGGNCSTTALGVGVGCTALNTKFNDFGTVRGRLGYAADNLLLYGTGGWAWSQSSTNSNFTCVGVGTCPGPGVAFTGGSSSASITATNGWAAGGGLEYAFTRNWTVRVEYLHIQFNGIGETLPTSGTVTGVPFTATTSSSATVNMDVARAGLNYLFH
jgi:outer membrane immunogenic protein